MSDNITPSNSLMEYFLKDYIPSFPPYLPLKHFLKDKRNGDPKSKAPSKFIIFRACITAEIKDLKFRIGDALSFSRIASNQWKKLPEFQKEAYKKMSCDLKELEKHKYSRKKDRKSSQNSIPQFHSAGYQEKYSDQLSGFQDKSIQNVTPQLFGSQDESTQKLTFQSDCSSGYQDKSAQNSAIQFDHLSCYQEKSIQNLTLQFSNYQNEKPTQNPFFQFDYSSSNQDKSIQNPNLQRSNSQEESTQSPALQFDHFPKYQVESKQNLILSFDHFFGNQDEPTLNSDPISSYQDENRQNIAFQLDYISNNQNESHIKSNSLV
ncbi:7157_t:CDS:1 [Ambispora leptoticha]|uniref:7157_t:CDS:1 n=1 Tax=Ambispora leptoticha TaxID=144679 RepID=A0A9N9EZD1_9GLOM|nr:7157_t:CDS:1 [Ambispora leptoticha]